MRTRVPSLALTLFVLGCSRGAPSTDPEPLFTADDRLSVEVENQNFYPATVYAYRPGARVRLGTVENANTATFRFDWPVPGDLRFLVDYLSVGCQLSDPLAVGPGDELMLILEPQDYRRASRDLCTALR